MRMRDEATGLYFELDNDRAQVADCDKRAATVIVPDTSKKKNIKK